MFTKILVANRGEIACRVIRTAKRMGIATVAIYSDADAQALHVEMADEAIAIGPAESAKSYLNIERIVQACLDSGAQAVHPGYGFLSENANFAAALRAQGICFIGPPEEAIRSMGDKIRSKHIAKEAGVNTIPGHPAALVDAEEAVKISAEIGYPVMLKASAGGGGKGMRIAHDEAQCREGFERATSEARTSFGDDRVFVEKYIEQPRHIEIQVLADPHGNIVYLGERECSLQRRHQKVIEEAPSPLLDEDMRRRMGEQAVALAHAVGYESAGTVEFVADANKNFYFLEMNTRLQVEHPVTELVTGIDLVEMMLRVANGEVLPIVQSDVSLSGWAIEARLYAEDPTREFLPSIGRLRKFRVPREDWARVDAGVVEGSEVSMHYDPMIAKLIVHAPTRGEAIDLAGKALDQTFIRGVQHNGTFLNALLQHPRFRAGELTTNFIDEEFPDGFKPGLIGDSDALLFSIVCVCLDAVRGEKFALWPQRGKAAESATGREQLLDKVVRIGGQSEDLRYIDIAIGSKGDSFSVCCAGNWIDVRVAWKPGDVHAFFDFDGHSICVQVEQRGNVLEVAHNGKAVEAMVLDRRTAELARLMPRKAPPDLSRFLLSPMPGLLRELSVVEGQAVKAGEEVAIVEAMKMENVLRASQDATVKKIIAEPGTSLQVDQAIVEFE